MKRSFVAALAVAAGLLSSAPALAAPTAPMTSSPVVGASLIEKVHGCHSEARDSYDGWHRHVGPFCEWVPASRRRHYHEHRRHAPRCRTVCKYVGPIKTCKQQCW